MDCSNLKKGDKVAMVLTGTTQWVYFYPVEKVNKLTIQVDGKKFYKNNGYQQGGGWNSYQLMDIEEGIERKKEIQYRQKLGKVNSAIAKLGLESSPELIGELLSIVDRYQ